MSSKGRYIFGAVTATLIVGGTIYIIKKSIDAKKLEAESINVEEAKNIVETGEEWEELVDDVIDEARDFASFNASFQQPKKINVFEANKDIPEEEEEEEEEDPEEGNGFYDDLDFNTPLAETIREEDKQLRHEPNSIEAKQQFLKMELAEWVPMEDTYQTMLKLFEFPFRPTNEGDRYLTTNIIENRSHFFGHTSRWTKEVTIADIFLHYARLADFNCGEGVRYWLEYFLEFNELEHYRASHILETAISDLVKHMYYKPETNTYGMFGLTPMQMEQAADVASKQVEPVLTFDIEFNEFLKGAV